MEKTFLQGCLEKKTAILDHHGDWHLLMFIDSPTDHQLFPSDAVHPPRGAVGIREHIPTCRSLGVRCEIRVQKRMVLGGTCPICIDRPATHIIIRPTTSQTQT